jgi:hypothetical protein
MRKTVYTHLVKKKGFGHNEGKNTKPVMEFMKN